MNEKLSKEIIQKHRLDLKIKTLKNEVLCKLNNTNSKLASFFEECSLYEDGKTLIALIDNGNKFIKKVSYFLSNLKFE